MQQLDIFCGTRSKWKAIEPWKQFVEPLKAVIELPFEGSEYKLWISLVSMLTSSAHIYPFCQTFLSLQSLTEVLSIILV